MQTASAPNTVALPGTAALAVTDVLPLQTVALAKTVLEVAVQTAVTNWLSEGCEHGAQV